MINPEIASKKGVASIIRWIELNTIFDQRGALTAIEENTDVPIEIRRIFYMHHIQMDRGGHAHMDTDQVIIGIHGSFKGTFRTPYDEVSYTFEDPSKGLYVPRQIFTEFEDFKSDAVCLVLANTVYNMKKSLRSWKEYVNFIKSQ